MPKAVSDRIDCESDECLMLQTDKSIPSARSQRSSPASNQALRLAIKVGIVDVFPAIGREHPDDLKRLIASVFETMLLARRNIDHIMRADCTRLVIRNQHEAATRFDKIDFLWGVDMRR